MLQRIKIIEWEEDTALWYHKEIIYRSWISEIIIIHSFISHKTQDRLIDTTTSASIGTAHTAGAGSLYHQSAPYLNIENIERGMYLLARPPRQTPLHPHHSARNLIANTRLAAMMMVYRCSCSSRASVVSAAACRGGGCAMSAVMSYFGLVGFVSGVGALEACHEGWFCGASCAGAAAEHFDVLL